MKALARASVIALAFAAVAPVAAQHRKVVDGIEINIGVVSTTQMLRVEAQEGANHDLAPARATHHVVVGLADARTGEAIRDARVTLDVEDPHGGLQNGRLDASGLRGYPDYSGLFRFGWAGPYRLRVNVARAGATPVSATFGWTQEY
jgi:hypothetical protein